MKKHCSPEMAVSKSSRQNTSSDSKKSTLTNETSCICTPAGSALKIAVSALAVCTTLIFQNALFLETTSLVTLYELFDAVKLYASLCLLYFSLQFFLLKQQVNGRKKSSCFLFALVFSPALFYITAILIEFPFNLLSLCTSLLSLASWLISLFLVIMVIFMQQKIPAPTISAQNPALSKRENEVAALILQGRTTQETADTLFISAATVKTHLQHIYEKTGVRNRTELARVMSEIKQQNLF